jgi:hypothetical protein
MFLLLLPYLPFPSFSLALHFFFDLKQQPDHLSNPLLLALIYLSDIDHLSQQVRVT